MLQTAFNALALGSVYALMAVGIGLVFGVLRLVNFAYGQLIMAGAYTLAIGSEHNWPQWASVLACFGVVIALSLLMELGLFRPLRGASPATMLVATFAVAFLLQSIALLKFGPLVKTATLSPGLFDPTGHREFDTVRNVIVGGLDRLWTATLGGFGIGVVTSVFTDELSSAHAVYVDSFVFGLVILVLLLRPEGLFAPFGGRPVERA